jgi:PhzF family phenazine biosynthesis protein
LQIPIYQVDAFTDRLFHGNPAAVCPLEDWLPDTLMQRIASENNLAETAFYVRRGGRFAIRWFTPLVEVDLCGHATLATAYVIFQVAGYGAPLVEFDSRSGQLRVTRSGDMLTLDFPCDPAVRTDPREDLATALGSWPLEFHKGKTDYLLLYSSQEEIEAMQPDFHSLAQVPAQGIIVTAKGRDVDFVSRFFAPQVGISEDPATGSSHTTLTPFWAQRLGRVELSAMQLSPRQGWMKCRLGGNRVHI